MHWFTSDTHFGHRNILGKAGRAFADVHEMDEALIGNWNYRVKPGDTVYHLGDFSFARPDDTIRIVKRLNGQIRLVPGNHDSDRMQRGLTYAGVEVLPPLYHTSIDGRALVLCHFPMLTWKSAHYGAWHLHGHSHGRGKWQSSTRLDVGVDALPEKYRPYSWPEIVALMQSKTYEVVDHHVQR